MLWSLARSPLLQRELPTLSGELQTVGIDRLEEFSGEELSMMIRDLTNLNLSSCRCAVT